MSKKGPVNLAEIDNPVIHKAFKYFCRHLVSLVCRLDPTDTNHCSNRKPDFRAFSCQIIVIRGIWCLLTAGHIIEKLDRITAGGQWTVQFSIVDDLGPSPVYHDPIPFDYEQAPKAFIDDVQEGLDFGIVALLPNYRERLEKNLIVPIENDHWKNQTDLECDRHMMLGFPAEFTGKDIQETENGYHLNGSLSPTLTWVQKLDCPPPDVLPTVHPQFVGLVRGTTDLDGMSGCPIFGFEKGRDDRYWIVAIQNSWFSDRRIIFGTSVPTLAKRMEGELDAVDAKLETDSI
jgi:hypothetical protein